MGHYSIKRVTTYMLVFRTSEDELPWDGRPAVNWITRMCKLDLIFKVQFNYQGTLSGM